MKLSDIMSAMHVTAYAEVALVIFFAVFLGVVVHLLQGRDAFEQARRLPLEERATTPDQERRP